MTFQKWQVWRTASSCEQHGCRKSGPGAQWKSFGKLDMVEYFTDRSQSTCAMQEQFNIGMLSRGFAVDTTWCVYTQPIRPWTQLSVSGQEISLLYLATLFVSGMLVSFACFNSFQLGMWTRSQEEYLPVSPLNLICLLAATPSMCISSQECMILHISAWIHFSLSGIRKIQAFPKSHVLLVILCCVFTKTNWWKSYSMQDMQGLWCFESPHSDPICWNHSAT